MQKMFSQTDTSGNQSSYNQLQKHNAALPGQLAGRFLALSPSSRGFANVRAGSCVTSVAGPNGDAQLYER